MHPISLHIDNAIVSKRSDGSANVAYMGGTLWVPKGVAETLDVKAKTFDLPVRLYSVQTTSGKAATAVIVGD